MILFGGVHVDRTGNTRLFWGHMTLLGCPPSLFFVLIGLWVLLFWISIGVVVQNTVEESGLHSRTGPGVLPHQWINLVNPTDRFYHGCSSYFPL